MPFVHIVKPGLQTTVQDEGRWGLQSHGVPVAGPMDPCSYRIANALVRNDRNQAALEIAFIGPEIEFEDERLVAVAGAEFAMSLDGVAVQPNAAFVAGAGSRLRFGTRVRGSRAYLAIAGGVAVPPVMGSRATHLVSRLGGLEGRALTAGDRLPLGDANGAQMDSSEAAPGERRTPDRRDGTRMRTFGCCRARSVSIFHQTHSISCNRLRIQLAGSPIAWGFASRGRSFVTYVARISSPTPRPLARCRCPHRDNPSS